MHDIEAAAELFGGVGVARPEVESAIRQLLDAFGEDACREGLERTPERVARMYDELLAGYRVDPFALINEAVFDVDYDDMVIVKSTIDLAHNLGLNVVAEGIETDDVYRKLKQLGCDTAQGYLISHPLSAEKFDTFLKKNKY